ncbi:PIN domain-like protein [Ramaria rubella]|nr:PIN domain-like protein [Ramaria rubella]KAF8575242.1 PIN domain-like protein [Ramaria rubella]
MGVKQLWTLLGPVGRPVLLETMEGKTMAIDSSIWIYQFQATMRDKDGRALVNAHVLGFLRRICKLLFYGIKPVFVFDGGAPVLKRMTITERKRKKAGAADSHARVAEKLLAAHMRREAISHVQQGKTPQTSSAVVVDENTVYLEDLESNTTPSKPQGKPKASTKSPDSARKKAKFYDHDPYRLPEVDPASITQPTSSLAPDPRLATEEELRTFIDAMRPEDFDVSSPAFRDLPTEVQYEIIGDLRLKSRQTSYKRLQTMLRNASTPLDFSKAQIRNLQQRNALTQQLLETTDSIGKANVVIPVRIASERNKEYVLVKNQGDEGGWVLGIRDEGTSAKPIVIDDADRKGNDSDDLESDMEMEKVAIAGPVVPDPDLREYHGRMALASIARRHSPKKHTSRSPQKSKVNTPTKPDRPPLFMDDDAELEIAIQQSLDQQESDALQKAIQASKEDALSSEASSSAEQQLGQSSGIANDSDDDLYEAAPSRLETALSFANTSPNKRSFTNPFNTDASSIFGSPTLLLSESAHKVANAVTAKTILTVSSDEDEEMEEILPTAQRPASLTLKASGSPQNVSTPRDLDENRMTETATMPMTATRQETAAMVFAPSPQTKTTPPSSNSGNLFDVPRDTSGELSPQQPSKSRPPDVETLNTLPREADLENDPYVTTLPPAQTMLQTTASVEVPDEDFLSDWDRSPSPAAGPSQEKPSVDRRDAEAWDAAQEMDIAAEEGDFAQFVSQVKGQDLDAARRDIDDEIRELNKQKKVAMRDSEDITQQMISQIMLMLRLFGIPYITAPMEAEAQCATLVSLGLVEGVITDDSDVFLFGGMRVFKNMFNQSKTVECFLLNDLARELGLERDKLIRLAYLLGSDYVEGLPGVGPVVAMELMKEFPGEDGLHKFREWWKKVQSGKDTVVDTNSLFRKRFKKRFKALYLPDDWPNPAVRDAYYHPAVDESEEPFKWGLPDLDGLQHFFREELSWSQTKVDDLLLPIIRKMGQRGQAAAANKQGTLNNYFDISLGSGTYAPRRRQAYSSKRLQQVVADFRAAQGKSQSVGPGTTDEDDATSEIDGPPKKKRKGKDREKEPKRASAKKRGRGSNNQRGRGRKRKTMASPKPENEQDLLDTAAGNATPPSAMTARLRPRPKPNYKGTLDDEDDEQGSDGSDDEFVITR